MANLYVILVNWNGHRDTIECLESLLRADHSEFRVIIVDNGSADGSIEAIRTWATAEPSTTQPSGPPWPELPIERKRQPSLRVIRRQDPAQAEPTDAFITLIDTGENLGFAGANNLGMRVAAADPSCAFFWLLNNDTVVAPDSLTKLIAFAQRQPEIGILGSCLLFYHDPKLVQGLGGFFYPWRGRGGHLGLNRSRDQLPPLSEVEADLSYVMGAAMFVRREVFEQIGGMSEDYFLYFEELDWARRLAGRFRQSVCLDAVVFHKEGVGIGTSSVSRPSDTSLYALRVNLLRYMWRFDKARFPMALGRLVREALKYLRDQDATAVKVHGLALADFISGVRRRGPHGSSDFANPSKQ